MKRALLIGINNYNRLQRVGYAKNDAESVAAVLQNVYHFKREEIVLMTDQCRGIFTPTQNNIEEQILALRQFESLDFLLFGFWGHGVIDDQLKRYLCVQDTSTDIGRLQRTALSLDLVMDVLKQTAVPQTCVLLDCCQNIAAARGEAPASLTMEDCDLFNQGARDIVAASEEKHHANPAAQPVVSTTIIMNSCSATQRAYEWSERQHGIFTAHLLEAMTATPRVSQWAQHVSERVPLTAINYGHTQVPYISMDGGTDIQIPGFQKSPPDSNSNPEVVISEDPNQVQVRDYQVGEIQIKFEKITGSQEVAPRSEKVVLPAIPSEIRELQGELAGIEKLQEEVAAETATVLRPAKESIESARQQRDQIAKRQSDFWAKINPSKEERRHLETVINDQMDTTVSPLSLCSGKPDSISMPNFVQLVLWQQKKMQSEAIVLKTEEEYKEKRAELIEKLDQQKKDKIALQQTATTTFYAQVIDLILSVCPGYDKAESPVPNEELVPLLPLLDQYCLGRSDVEIWEMAENHWLENRPCVTKEKEGKRQKQADHRKFLAIKGITAVGIILTILFVVIFTINQSTPLPDPVRSVSMPLSFLAEPDPVRSVSAPLEGGSADQAGAEKTLRINGIKCVFKWCPPGRFMMGSPADEQGRYEDESQHDVNLTRGFWLLEHEVTQEIWESVMGANPSYFKGDNLPVEQVSWDDCHNFIDELNKSFNSLSLRFRLPTEAEWEYACRAGTRTPYSFGQRLNGDKANCNGNFPYGTETEGPYLEKTTPVKSYDSNAWGLYDMHGNVWEWCEDRYGAYSSGSDTDPHGSESGSFRVGRGGGWGGLAEGCRSASRIRSDPEIRSYFLGFRLALSSTD